MVPLQISDWVDILCFPQFSLVWHLILDMIFNVGNEDMRHDWCSDISHQIWNMGRSPSYRLILRFSPWFSCWLGFDIWILAIRISFGGFWAALDTLSVYSLAGLGLYFYIWKLLYLYFDAGRLFCLFPVRPAGVDLALRLPQVLIKPRMMHSSSSAVHWRQPAELG